LLKKSLEKFRNFLAILLSNRQPLKWLRKLLRRPKKPSRILMQC
jgi:hypothetical protein